MLGQVTGTGIEVIAVDDASDDDCGALLDERASSDSRLTVLHLNHTGGPGNARNLGLARATGDYVWFVDGDDLLTPGAVRAVVARLAGTQPDVLLIGYLDLFPDGSTAPSEGQALLGAAARSHDDAFPLSRAPELINATMTAWSKLFRREFLIGLREPFRSGIHEDIPVTCAALLGGQLCVLDTACYCYRRSRTGSFMATSSTDHLAVFSAYEEVFAMLRKRAGDQVVTPAVRAAVFERAISHYAAVLQTTGFGIGRYGQPGLVPRCDRRRFFERMHEDFTRYAPDGYEVPGGARGFKLALIKHDAYRTYELLEPLNRGRVALGRVRRGHRGQRRAADPPGRA